MLGRQSFDDVLSQGLWRRDEHIDDVIQEYTPGVHSRT
jgi:hypothetical protein